MSWGKKKNEENNKNFGILSKNLLKNIKLFKE